MSFTTTPLMGGGVLVTGKDVEGKKGKTVLVSPAWDAVLKLRTHAQATDEFNAMVEEFFAPIVTAADAYNEAVADPTSKWGTVVLTEGVEGVPGKSIELDEHGVLLRLIAETDGSMLRWLDKTTLVAISQ